MEEKILGLRTLKCSWFASVVNRKPEGVLTFEEVADILGNPQSRFRAGSIKKITEKARECLAKSDRRAYDNWKRQMPIFTPAGEFYPDRKISNCVQETGFALIDFDHLNKKRIEEVMAKAQTLPYVFFAWKSLSAEGIHLLISLPDSGSFKMNIEPAQRQVIRDLNIPGLELDKVCKDVSRCCFFNFDEDFFVNWNAEPMEIDADVWEAVKSPVGKGAAKKPLRRGICNQPDIRLFGSELEGYFERKLAGMVKGSTATPTCGLAGLCNSRGYAQEEAADFCWKRFGTRLGQTEEEFRRDFNSIYRRHPEQFGSKKNESLDSQILTSSSCHPKFIGEQWSDTFVPFHDHCFAYDILVEW